MMKTWLITGASRGLGVEMAKAALASGERVIATGRDARQVTEALGEESDRLQILRLDVTDNTSISGAVEAAVARFGQIDVLVNNAGYGHLGFFEETTDTDARTQFESNVFGLMNVTRAVLPIMRSKRSGRIFNLSSLAGMRGSAFSSLYSASKFAVEGFSEALAEELAPFGISVTIIAPGPFRTDFLSGKSLRVGSASLPAYAEARERTRATFEARNGKQAGDPARLAAALLHLANDPQPPMRFVAGTAAVQVGLQKLDGMKNNILSWHRQSIATDGDYDDASPWRPARQPFNAVKNG